MKDQILEDYKTNKRNYHDFRERVVHLLTDLLSEQSIQIHQISSRTKSLESLSKKIETKNEKYNSIDEITDIVGIRVIAYLESHVDSISDLIEKEFIIDDKNSIDKRKLKADQFGYRSLHIVASFNIDRCNLKEYKRYKGIKCEIQVRSILQHAWAEIEHDLGYKGEVSIPDPYKRTFNRLSALLETADVEFDRLKTELKDYKRAVPDLIKTEPKFVDINSTSISFFIKTNKVLLDVKQLIEQKIGNELKETSIEDFTLKALKYFKMESIGDLENSLTKDKKTFEIFTKIFINEKLENARVVLSIAPLMYYMHFLAARSQSIELLSEYFIICGYQINTQEGNQYLDFYRKSVL